MTAADDHRFRTPFKYAPVKQTQNIANKRRIIEVMQAMTNEPIDRLDEVARAGFAADIALNVTHPLNEMRGIAAALERLWEPMRRALPDVERRDNFVAGGRYRDANWIGCMGHFMGTFERDWLGIPATRGVVSLRYCEGHELRGDKIAASYIFLDFLDLMRQAGCFPIAESLGTEMRWMPPLTRDGVILTAQDEQRSRRTIETVLKMHAALGHYRGQAPTRAVLDEMEMVKHWHPNFMWYGPAGIGSTRGLRGFEDYHQIPFLVAFPDRGGSEQGHFIRIGDGFFAVTGGWGYLQATHSGGELFGLPSTGKRIKMRVMDFYRCDDKTIVENWVPMDVPHILLQMGVDVFGRMRHQCRQHDAISASEWLVKTERGV